MDPKILAEGKDPFRELGIPENLVDSLSPSQLRRMASEFKRVLSRAIHSDKSGGDTNPLQVGVNVAADTIAKLNDEELGALLAQRRAAKAGGGTDYFERALRQLQAERDKAMADRVRICERIEREFFRNLTQRSGAQLTIFNVGPCEIRIADDFGFQQNLPGFDGKACLAKTLTRYQYTLKLDSDGKLTRNKGRTTIDLPGGEIIGTLSSKRLSAIDAELFPKPDPFAPRLEAGQSAAPQIPRRTFTPQQAARLLVLNLSPTLPSSWQDEDHYLVVRLDGRSFPGGRLYMVEGRIGWDEDKVRQTDPIKPLTK